MSGVFMGHVENDEQWVEVHDTLLDTWYGIYTEVRNRFGYPVGKDAILPVPVVTNIVCMHNCDCTANSEYIFAIAGHTEGSRWENLRLVAICEPCLRRTGAQPAGEVAGGPVQ